MKEWRFHLVRWGRMWERQVWDGSQESGLGFRSETSVRHPSKAVKEKLNMGLEFRGEVWTGDDNVGLLTKPWSRGRQPKLRLETLDRGRGLGRAEWDTWATDSKACSLEIHHPSPRLVFTASSRFCNSVHTNKVCGLKVTALESFAFKQCSSDSHFRNPFLRTILKSLQYTFNYRTSLWVANLNLLKVVLTFRKRHKPFVVKSWD